MRGLLEEALLPPVGILLLVLAAVPFARRRMLVASAGAVALLLLSTSLGEFALMRPLEGLRVADAPLFPPAAIVVLGGDASGVPGAVTPGPLTLGRMWGGAALARGTSLPVLVTAGPDLSRAMADGMARSLQAPARWVDDAAADTAGNAAGAARILRGAGIRSVYLVTDRWHMPRASLAFRDAGFDVTPAPVGSEEPVPSDAGSLVPRPRGLLTAYYAFHEWAGLAWYGLSVLGGVR